MYKGMAYYKISCAVMGILTFVAAVITAIYATSGENLFTGPVAAALLSIFGILTAVCLCISSVNGKTLYKLGFYVLHIGIVVAVIGFIVYGIAGKKYTVSVLCNDTYYNAINDVTESSKGEMVHLGFNFRLDDTYTEYYTDENGNATSNPKTYIAYITFNKDGVTDTVELKVNYPVTKDGYKIYLMGMVEDRGLEGATLLFKKNPAEYTILAGLVLLISGSFVTCFLGGISLKPKKTVGKAKEGDEK